MLINSMPPEILKMKISSITEFLSISQNNEEEINFQSRNCIYFNFIILSLGFSLFKEEDTSKNLRLVLFDLKQIKEKILDSQQNLSHNKIQVSNDKNGGAEVNKNLLTKDKENNKISDLNKNKEMQDGTPCFSKTKSHKELRITHKKLNFKELNEKGTKNSEENEENKKLNKGKTENKSNDTLQNSTSQVNFLSNLPKTKSTKLNDIKTFVSRYRSPSPIISKKSKNHTNQIFLRQKSDSNLNFNMPIVPFTPVKNDNKSNTPTISNILNTNNSKAKSNNMKTPTMNKENTPNPNTNLPWYP
jgi:hypothetical protein